MGGDRNDERGGGAGHGGRGEPRAEYREDLGPAAELPAEEEASRDVLVDHRRHDTVVRGGPARTGRAAPPCRAQKIGVPRDREAAPGAHGGRGWRESRPAVEARAERLQPLEGPATREAVRGKEEREDRRPRAAMDFPHGAPHEPGEGIQEVLEGGGTDEGRVERLSRGSCTPAPGRGRGPPGRSPRGSSPRPRSTRRTRRTGRSTPSGSRCTSGTGIRAARAPSP